jgi:hypothetical protein
MLPLSIGLKNSDPVKIDVLNRHGFTGGIKVREDFITESQETCGSYLGSSSECFIYYTKVGVRYHFKFLTNF